MDIESRRDLEVLEAITQNDRISQRTLALRLGIALGLANVYVRRLARKGYIKSVGVRSNRLRYLVTPKGIAEKTRLTFEYMMHSLKLYRDARIQLRTLLEPLILAGTPAVAIYGTGEAAELTYLSLMEFGLEPVAVFDASGGARFLGMTVAAVDQHESFRFDTLVIASLDHADDAVARLCAAGVPEEKLVRLRPAL